VTGDRLEVGRIVKAHGIRGEVVVEAVSNRPERFAPGAVLHAGEARAFTVRRATPQGGPDPVGRVSRARWIVSFEGVDERNQAERLRGTVLSGDPLANDTGGDELWVHELVGSELVDPAGRVLGRVAAVEANPASDLLVLESGHLVPMVFVVEAGAGRVVVDPPAGLLD
jgi:16S rRNA processing protein RimM